ncbi:sulfonate transport system substrate-binding protein [Cereibacter ovatus]|uniref:Putative aliphatic sulfonates-binding protein n=1 Tax=Cereibacter ovatus TaxID=439529 RepID=A0A285D4J0_9RHOB|nr:aliphatic sulfonate ABC transporter substrate-binding protein [Cereibacter ovatus]SNX74063.1 sulfonate transport system substrate-binding protein [Cereibacter ovatus]
MTLTRRLFLAATAALALATSPALAEPLREIRIDWATYNPLSLLIREKGLLEREFEKDGIAITWVQSAGSNKALEFLNAGSLDVGSSAGSAALLARINGNPIRSVYSYSRPEWTALVTRADSGITSVADLKGRTVAVTRGTDPHVFLVRALAEAGLSQDDVRVVLLQHADGRTALIRGDVDAWAGLDPLMASAEIEDGALLFHRDPAANTWGILNVREAFLEENPAIVERVLKVYEAARHEAEADPAGLKRIVAGVTGLPAAVVDRQLDERTDLSQPRIGTAQRESILRAGVALQAAGVIEAAVDVPAMVDALLDDRLPAATN